MKIEAGITAVVTGGASGLGASLVRNLASKGANVLICDMNQEKAEQLMAELGNKSTIIFQNTNVAEEKSVAAALATAVNKFGGVHMVVNCAAIATPRKVISGSGTIHPLNSFNKIMQVNVGGTFNVLRLAASIMAKQEPVCEAERGVIINVASVAAWEGQIGQAAYSASKGAVVAMALPIARELSRHGIRVNTIAPGIMGTPMLLALPERAKKSLEKQVVFPKRMGYPSEFANMCVTIAENQYLNGTFIRLDGGIRMAAL